MAPPQIKQPQGYVRGNTPLGGDAVQLALHVRKELEKVQRFQPNTRTVAVTANYVVQPQDRTILVDTTAGDVTLTLFRAAQLIVLPLSIVKVSADAHVVNVAAAVGDTVAGAASISLPTAKTSYSLTPDGITTWRVDGLGAVLPGNALLFLNGVGAFTAPAGGGGGARTTHTLTTAALANLATETGSTIINCKSAVFLTIQADRAAWARFYTDSASQVADASRAFGVKPTAGTGVLAEFVFSAAQTVLLSPVAILTNDEAVPQQRVWYAVQNRSGAASTVALTMGILPVET